MTADAEGVQGPQCSLIRPGDRQFFISPPNYASLTNGRGRSSQTLHGASKYGQSEKTHKSHWKRLNALIAAYEGRDIP